MSMIKEITETSIEKTLVVGGLAWDVHEESLMTQSLVDVTNRKAIVRNDNNEVVGVVGNKYTPIQNSEAFGLFASVAEEYEPVYKRATTFHGGSQVVLQADLNKSFTVNGNDRTDMRLTLINNHDGGGSLQILLTPVRLFCMNQLSLAKISAFQKFSIRHTSNYKIMMEEAYEALSHQHRIFKNVGDAAEILAQSFVDRNMVETFLEELFPVDDTKTDRHKQNTHIKRGHVKDFFVNGKGNEGKTLWDLYNGVTEFTTHHMGSDTTRFKRNIQGDASRLASKAFDLALEMV